MTRPVALFVGSASSSNVRRLVDNLSWMLDGLPEIHLVTTDPGTFEPGTTAPFELFGGEHSSSVRGEFRALRDYIDAANPAAVIQLTRPPIHGTMGALATARTDTAFVYRYSGDRFYEYRVARGRQRLTAFALGNALGRIPLWAADRCVVLGPNGKARLTSRGVDADDVSILPPSVDVDTYRADPDAGPIDVPDGRTPVLFVGRLSRLKGRGTLERVLPRVLDRRSDIQFVLVGAQADALSLTNRYEDHVTAIGRIAPAAMPAYYRQAALVLHPSLTEGVPRVLLEALAAGTPVLAHAVGDVDSVTDNTFTTDDELIAALQSLESLPLDNVTPFARETLRPRYREFVRSLRSGGTI